MSCSDTATAEKDFERENRRVWILLAVGLGFTMVFSGILDVFLEGVPLGFVVPILNRQATVSMIVYHAVVIVAGLYIGVLGVKELVFEKRFSVEFLMSVAAFGALYLDFLFEAATVLFLYSLAEYFEGYIEDRARKTVERLSHFMPDKATVIAEGTEKTVEVRDIQPDMTVIVKPGERIALDGTVIDGNSSIDQSLVTGESVPVEKKPGDCVYAGTLNTNGVLKISVTKGAEGTLVSRIVQLVIESRKRKAVIERTVDKLARVYVPIVIVLAAFTALVLPRLAGGTFDAWLYRSLILLVISCPSAFIVSIPATLFTAVTIAARKGVLIKGGVYIEKMAKIKSVIFDKTGTLTLGTPSVHCISCGETTDEEALKYAAALEQFSKHPLAQTVVKKAKEQHLDFGNLKVENVEEVPGKGLVGHVNGVHVAVGNMQLMKEQACDCAQIGEIYEQERHTAVCVSLDRAVVASICIMDEVRQDAVKAVKDLEKDQIHTAMLTGDKREIAEQVAKELDIDEVYAELFPEDKLRILNEVKSKHQIVSMVGDGVNDAPVLAASDVGIAMGGSRVDAALESADVVLVRDQLVQIPYLIKLSRKTMKIAHQNIVVSLGVKIVLGILGLFGLIPLWFTVASGDDGVTMLLLLNTLRLTNVKN